MPKLERKKAEKLCPLCVRHRKMATVDGLSFWVEYDMEGEPLLISEAQDMLRAHIIRISNCPMCGRGLELGEEMVVEFEDEG